MTIPCTEGRRRGLAFRALAPSFASLVAAGVMACGAVPVGRDPGPGPAAEGPAASAPAELTDPGRAGGDGTAPPTGGDSRRVVAVGDLHGDLQATREALRLGGLIDGEDRWIGGATVLVQTGDQLDRGDDEPEILALLERLAQEAAAVGGEVHVLNGNHELMNAAGDLRYVTPGGLEDFAAHDPGPEGDLAGVPAAARGRLAAFRPGGPWARKLAERDVVLVHEGTVFVHGGVTPRWAAVGPEAINAAVRRWLVEGGEVPAAVRDPDGPVWSRAFSDAPDVAACAALELSLERLGARRMVVGHTVQAGGIASACDGRVWMIDVGMAAHYGGSPAALEIVDGEPRPLAP